MYRQKKWMSAFYAILKDIVMKKKMSACYAILKDIVMKKNVSMLCYTKRHSHEKRCQHAMLKKISALCQKKMSTCYALTLGMYARRST
jgi:hypothetical protein